MSTQPLTRERPFGSFGFPSRVLNSGSARINFFEWGPERVFVVEPQLRVARANILFVHGLSDHPARHFQTARWLAELGCRTVLFDLVGHGGRQEEVDRSWWINEAYAKGDNPSAIAMRLRTQGPERAATEPAFRPGQYQTLLHTRISDQIGQAGKILGRLVDSPGSVDSSPLFLMGYSMGGLISSEVLGRWSRRIGDLRGAIFLSPAFKPQGRPGRVLENLAFEAAWQLRLLPFSLFRTAFKSALQLNLGLDTTWGPPWISDLLEEVELFKTDPLVHQILPSAYVGSIEGQMAKTDPNVSRFPADALVLVPGRDGITSVQGGIHFAERARRALGPDRVELVCFEDVCAHDLLRSSVRQEVREAIRRWIERRLAA